MPLGYNPTAWPCGTDNDNDRHLLFGRGAWYGVFFFLRQFGIRP